MIARSRGTDCPDQPRLEVTVTAYGSDDPNERPTEDRDHRPEIEGELAGRLDDLHLEGISAAGEMIEEAL